MTKPKIVFWAFLPGMPVGLMMMMMTKSMKYILQEILVGDEGIAGDGGLWPTDLLHCDDQTLVSFDFDQNVTFPIL